jgi:hypothetical protein
MLLAETPGESLTGRAEIHVRTGCLEDAEYNRANEGKGNICGYYAKSADERIYEIHLGELPGFTSCPHLTLKVSKAFPAQKGSVAVHPSLLQAAVAGNMVKNS